MRNAGSAIIDKDLTKEEIKELFNGLKDGAITLVISTNIKHLTETVKYEDEGFEVRDTILWVHTVNKKENITPILLLRKPITLPNLALNILKNRTGVLNIGATRIPFNAKNNLSVQSKKEISKQKQMLAWIANDNGRFPSNIIFSKKLLPEGTYYTTTETNSKASLIKLLTILIKPKHSTMLLIQEKGKNNASKWIFRWNFRKNGRRS